MPVPSAASLSDTERKQIKTRNICRDKLEVILDTVCNANTDHLDPRVCETAGILQKNLSLDGESSCMPNFFNRYRGTFDDDLEDLSDDDEISAYIPEREARRNARGLHMVVDEHISRHCYNEAAMGSYLTSWDRLWCGDLCESAFGWQASLVALALTNPSTWPRPAEGPIPPLPHVKCLIYTGVIGDNRLLRSEIKAIIKIMRGRLFVKSVRPHLMAPVMLFSVMAPWHVRILEAYFDGRKLVVRNTPLYDMRNKVASEAVMENLCYWWYGNSIGNTKALPHGDDLA